MATRRAMFKALIGTGLCATLEGLGAEEIYVDVPAADKAVLQERARTPLYISGARLNSREFQAVLFDSSGNVVATLPMLARVHGMAFGPRTGQVAVFARRPGLSLLTFDLSRPDDYQVTPSMANRHFYGHGAYSDSGNLLFATENDYNSSRGVVGVYDVRRRYERMGEIDTGGIGPHEIVRIPGTQYLLVANGGIQTHPDTGREKLNLASMQSSLSIVDIPSASIIARHVLPDSLHQLSIRHVACADDGSAWFAGQFEGTTGATVPLAGVMSVPGSVDSFSKGLSRDGLELIDLPESICRQTRNYLSSVTISGCCVTYTSSHGGLAFLVDRNTREVVQSLPIFDCSGAAPGPFNENQRQASAIVTTGAGEIVLLDHQGVVSLAQHQLQWDNHVYRL